MEGVNRVIRPALKTPTPPTGEIDRRLSNRRHAGQIAFGSERHLGVSCAVAAPRRPVIGRCGNTWRDRARPYCRCLW